ncbi:hypothetical protein LTR10_022002 [Elasticomyces elasticus]|uniref:VWFA domain-containing protein n=1 Tax=Exophiala sideris TaxID=1016849 RepID=A0ABR0IZF1_9EURO|nr:hypothetical protein LTR10_022002 [Elasticomyces elasticus]KAK5022918.1 hypothetical protein LTS07_009646 [Exophiala sideris]KAK5026403.1 hypothetical protein LTR13_010017 [Exophiala sideris]KAK5052338.1 hypothetical protein LTR69_009874 [Exophiala sideris]KAK5177365.1 hypothetical protein LTR44_010160 [Eurotiomycetes sp. CCFEE 6388]
MENPIIMPRNSFHSQTSSSSASRVRDSMSFLKKFSSKRSSSNASAQSGPKPQPPLGRRNHNNANTPFATTTPTRRPRPAENMGAPPPYTAAPYSPADVASSMQVGDDSPYAFLREFDTVFLIDDSGSMAGRSWRETSAALSAIAPVCTAHDADGIDIYFLNHRNPNSHLGGYTNVTTTQGVQNLFQSVRPLGGTPTGTRLNQILKPYLVEVAESLERQAHGHEATVKPLNIIVITDGVPSDDVEMVIVNAAKKLDKFGAEPWQVGIQFFQVGREPEAAENLRELDDSLSEQYNIRDMVDTVPWNGEEGQELTAQGLLKVCLGSVVRRWDRKAL